MGSARILCEVVGVTPDTPPKRLQDESISETNRRAWRISILARVGGLILLLSLCSLGDLLFHRPSSMNGFQWIMTNEK